MCSPLSHSLEGSYEKSECSVLLDVARPSGQEPGVLCAVPGGSAAPGLFPRRVGVPVLMIVSTYIKKEFQRDASWQGVGFRCGFLVIISLGCLIQTE